MEPSKSSQGNLTDKNLDFISGVSKIIKNAFPDYAVSFQKTISNGNGQLYKLVIGTKNSFNGEKVIKFLKENPIDEIEVKKNKKSVFITQKLPYKNGATNDNPVSLRTAWL